MGDKVNEELGRRITRRQALAGGSALLATAVWPGSVMAATPSVPDPAAIDAIARLVTSSTASLSPEDVWATLPGVYKRFSAEQRELVSRVTDQIRTMTGDRQLATGELRDKMVRLTGSELVALPDGPLPDDAVTSHADAEATRAQLAVRIRGYTEPDPTFARPPVPCTNVVADGVALSARDRSYRQLYVDACALVDLVAARDPDIRQHATFDYPS